MSPGLMEDKKTCFRILDKAPNTNKLADSDKKQALQL
jgi:hypothetical protein